MERRRLSEVLAEILGMTSDEFQAEQRRLRGSSGAPSEEIQVEQRRLRESPGAMQAGASRQSAGRGAAPPASGRQPIVRRPAGESERIIWSSVPVVTETKPAPTASGNGTIDWNGSGKDGLPDPVTLVGLEDAFDHTPLVPGEKVVFCKQDKVAYHLATWQFLLGENEGRCCICRRSNVFAFLTLPGHAAAPFVIKAKPAVGVMRPGDKVIGLKEVHDYVNMAVVVQDYVNQVYQTKSTGTYFIRFEPREANEPVYSGFKVVVFPKYESAWSEQGLSIRDYQGKVIRVRGVIHEHPEWGIEILVNSPHLIEIVEDASP